MGKKLGHSKISTSINKWDWKCTLLSSCIVQNIFWAGRPFSSALGFPLMMERFYGLLKVVTRKYNGCWNPASLGVGQWNIKVVLHHSSLSFRSLWPHLQGWECKNKWNLDGKFPGCICILAELGSISQWKGVCFWQVLDLIIISLEMSKHTLSYGLITWFSGHVGFRLRYTYCCRISLVFDNHARDLQCMCWYVHI